MQGKRSQSDCLLGRFSSLRSQQGRTHSSHSVRVGYSEESRIPEKSQEMSSGTQTTVRIPRSTMELEGVTSFPASGKTGRFQATRTHPSIKSFSCSCSEIPRQGRLCSTGSTAREVTTATPSDGGDTGLEIRRTDYGQRIQAYNQMVDTPSDRRDGPEVLHSAAVNDYRCFQFRGGATLDDRSASGRWSAAERDLHINHLELLAVFRGVKSFRRHLRNRRVTVHLDNITAHLSKEGGTRSAHLNKLTMEILLFCRNRGVVLTPAYLPGIANLGADALSRGKETSEWFINPIVTSWMFRRFAHPQIDLFASNRSAQLVETYFSLDRRDKLSAGTNALNQTWAFNLMYAFPPPQIIPLILARMKECKGTLILVTPFWSRAAWLPELLQMSVLAPLRLPPHQSTERDLTTGRNLPSLQKLKLTVWLICGTPSRARGLITPWGRSSVDPGEIPRRINTPALGGHGQNGVGDTLYQELLQL